MCSARHDRGVSPARGSPAESKNFGLCDSGGTRTLLLIGLVGGANKDRSRRQKQLGSLDCRRLRRKRSVELLGGNHGGVEPADAERIQCQLSLGNLLISIEIEPFVQCINPPFTA